MSSTVYLYLVHTRDCQVHKPACRYVGHERPNSINAQTLEIIYKTNDKVKAIILENFGGIENFKLQEVENPKINDNDALIKIKATAFNPVDYQMRQGSAESKLLKSPILGRELSGDIIGIGKNVAGFKIGDKVTAYVGSLGSNGTYAEFISVPEELLAKNPINLTYEQATALPLVGMTALQCFERVKIPKGKAVFISGGTGAVGTVLIKLLMAKGSHPIFTTAGNEDSFKHLIELGLSKENIIDYKNNDLLPVLRTKTANGTFEYIIDLVGGKMSEICAELIDVYGTYVDITFLTTQKAKETLFAKATSIINIANYAQTYKTEEGKLSYYGKSLKELFSKIERNEISPANINIVGDLSIETVGKAHQLMEENQTKGKKLIMKIE